MKEPCPISRFSSLVYRSSQVFFDRKLRRHGVGSGQHFFLLRIYEEPGISVLELAQRGGYDNGTTTRAIQKLEAQGYVRCQSDERDRRVRRIYVTEKAMPVIRDTYSAKEEWHRTLMEGLSPEEQETAIALMEKISQNAQQWRRRAGDNEQEGRL